MKPSEVIGHDVLLSLKKIFNKYATAVQQKWCHLVSMSDSQVNAFHEDLKESDSAEDNIKHDETYSALVKKPLISFQQHYLRISCLPKRSHTMLTDKGYQAYQCSPLWPP